MTAAVKTATAMRPPITSHIGPPFCRWSVAARDGSPPLQHLEPQRRVRPVALQPQTEPTTGDKHVEVRARVQDREDPPASQGLREFDPGVQRQPVRSDDPPVHGLARSRFRPLFVTRGRGVPGRYRAQLSSLSPRTHESTRDLTRADRRIGPVADTRGSPDGGGTGMLRMGRPERERGDERDESEDAKGPPSSGWLERSSARSRPQIQASSAQSIERVKRYGPTLSGGCDSSPTGTMCRCTARPHGLGNHS